MDANEIVDELKVATGWKQISLVNDTIVLKFDMKEMHVINGLKQGNDSLYLTFDDFKEYPISFVVTAADSVHQYWTLGGRLHRINDLPAYVAFDPTKDRIIRKWYWNGLKHRLTGPAETMTKGFKVVEIPGFPDFYQETCEYATMTWFQEGFASRFPFCAEAKLERGQRIKHKETNTIHSPREDLPALTAEEAKFTWDTFVPSEQFRPVSADIVELSEIYDKDGKITSRACDECAFNWRRGDDIFAAEKCEQFNQLFGDELFSSVDLWGPFYPDDQIEFILISEFSRVQDSR